MARAKFIDDDAFEMMLERAKAGTKQVATAALQAGAAIIADQMRSNLEGILSPKATGQLTEAFGITPVGIDRWFKWNVHLGFDGYHTPGNEPIPLIARSFESGAKMGSRYKDVWWSKRAGPDDYWRKPTPFAKPAVQATKQRAHEAMAAAAEREFEKINKGG